MDPTALAALDRDRAYLETLAQIVLDPRLRGRFGWSDIVQQTWIEAYQDRDRLAGLDDPGRRRRLYVMLVNNLHERVRHERAGCRDVGREAAAAAALDQSSARLEGWLASADTGPAERAAAHEQAVRVMEAVAGLPDRQREALVLHLYHGWKLREIADRLGCTTGAVAGLHAQAKARLRERLADLGPEG